MGDPSEIQHAEELLRLHLMEWRDAGGHVESVTGAILRLIVARERFACECCTPERKCPDHGACVTDGEV